MGSDRNTAAIISFAASHHHYEDNRGNAQKVVIEVVSVKGMSLHEGGEEGAVVSGVGGEAGDLGCLCQNARR